jgi:hypothetical protein
VTLDNREARRSIVEIMVGGYGKRQTFIFKVMHHRHEIPHFEQ